jgi:Tol biopolymer transport system component
MWLDAAGNMAPLLPERGGYATPRVSPDGRKLTFIGAGSDVYVHDRERDATTKLTFTGGAVDPLWTPDGKNIAYQSRSGSNGIFLWTIWILKADGTGEPVQLLQESGNTVPWEFSPDGRYLVYFETNPGTGFDLLTMLLDFSDPNHPKAGKPEVYLRTPADEMLPRISHDGRWLAYRSNESGAAEIYVRPFPNPAGGKWQISTGGGLYAVWSNNGRELFFETPDNHIMVVDYSVDGGVFVPGKPRLWSDKQLFFAGTSNMDLAPDGKHFAVLVEPEAAAGDKSSVHVTMLLNFFDELKRRIPR